MEPRMDRSATLTSVQRESNYCRWRRKQNEGRVSRKEVPGPGLVFASTWNAILGEKPRPFAQDDSVNVVRSLIASIRVISGRGGRCGRRGVCTKAGQAREEGRDFKRHLVARRGNGDRSRLHHLRLVVPGINLHAPAQWQGSDLVELRVIQRWTLGCQSRQTAHGPTGGQRISQVRGQQRV